MNPAKLSAGVLEQWFAAYTFSCQEKRVAQHLSTHHIEFFLPVHKKINRWKNGLRMLIERPLFPSYVFVKIDCNDRVRVLELPGVHSIVGAGRQPIPLPFEEIEALRQSMHLVNAQPHPLLKSGEKVLIRKGPLEGMIGIIVRQKNNTRVILTLDLIMKSISVEVAEQDLEVVGHDPAPDESVHSLVSSYEVLSPNNTNYESPQGLPVLAHSGHRYNLQQFIALRHSK